MPSAAGYANPYVGRQSPHGGRQSPHDGRHSPHGGRHSPHGGRHSPQMYPERDVNQGMPQRSKSPKPSRSQRGKSPSQQEYYEPMSPKKGSTHRRAQSPSYRAQSPTRVSFEGVH